MIPLFNVIGNGMTALTGEASSFFEILPPDIEGQDAQTKERVFVDLESDLINTDFLMKIYSIKGKLFLNSFGEFTLSQGQMNSVEKPVEKFLEKEESLVHFYENYLTVGNQFIRIASIKDFPDELNLLEVISWPDFVLIFKKIPKIEAKKQINLKRKLHFSSLFKGMRDLDSENAYYQAEELLSDVTRDSKALFQAEFYFVLKAPTKIELDKLTDQVVKDFKGKGATLLIEERGLSFLYYSLVPGVVSTFKREIKLPSDFLSFLMPFHRDFISSEGLNFKSRQRNDVYIDLFNESALNYNGLITGTTGQGKSMFANKLLSFELNRGTKAMVLDLGNSFRKNALFHDGVVLSERFNPLQFKDPRYLKEFVLAVLEEKLGKKEEGRLFETILNIEVKTFKGFLCELEKSFPGIGFYFKEIEEFFTDEELPLNDFTYCDFSLYPEVMKAPLIIYLIEYFKNLKGRKIFVFDECWHLLEKNADYIAECFRTFRKHQASAIAISQNLDDFSGSQLGRVIIQNTYFKFLFKQSLSESEFIDPITKSLLDEILSQKGVYSEFLYLTETNKKPLRFYPSPLEYELFTSDRRDNNSFEFYMSEKGKYLSFQDAIKNYTEIKNPNWRAYE